MERPDTERGGNGFAAVRTASISEPTAPGRWPRWFQWAVVSLISIPTIGQGVLVLIRAALPSGGSGMVGDDFDLYIGAARRWLAGGSFYLADQVAAPYDSPWGQILYPPQALALFVPFTILPAFLFVLVPSVVIGWVVWSYRPHPWAWVVILLVLLVWPLTLLLWVAGNPTVWIVAFVALSTRWPWMSAFVWLKPSVFPFALAGIRDRRWWFVTGLTAVAGVLMLPMTVEWLNVVLNARGANSGILYSLSPGALSALLLPVIAWAGRSRECA